MGTPIHCEVQHWCAGYDVVGLGGLHPVPPTPTSCLAEILWRWPARWLPVDWDGVESPSLGVFKGRLDELLGDVV